MNIWMEGERGGGGRAHGHQDKQAQTSHQDLKRGNRKRDREEFYLLR